MVARRALHLYEEILLLALRDRRGTVHPAVHYRHALAGAVVAELLLDGRAAVESKRRKQFLRLDDRSPAHDPLIDACLEKIGGARRRATLQTWVGRLAGIGAMKHRAARGLCRRGILRAEEDRVLLLFRRRIAQQVLCELDLGGGESVASGLPQPGAAFVYAAAVRVTDEIVGDEVLRWCVPGLGSR